MKRATRMSHLFADVSFPGRRNAMVREVQLSWDSELPYPAELEQTHWDTEVSSMNDLPEVSHKFKKKNTPPRHSSSTLNPKKNRTDR
ncbi:hypothetical protein OAF98_05430 [Planctomicrobium sp.]|nr:hypothetical protein [Planctomicrobium sp.]MDB4743909.1 hypothetical protein [Planctomicrobium sp.]